MRKELYLIHGSKVERLRVLNETRAEYICLAPDDDSVQIVLKREVLSAMPVEYGHYHRINPVFDDKDLAQRYLHKIRCSKLEEVYGV